MGVRDWHVRSDGTEFEAVELFDIDGENLSDSPRFLVEEWVYRTGFHEHRTFDNEENALAYARGMAQHTGGRYRVLMALDGHGFERIERE